MTVTNAWPPLPPLEGDPPWGLPPFAFGPEDPNTSTQDLVTRQMCGAVHLDGAFANTVAGELLSVPHRAVWPAWHVDYVRLARHAKFSRERRMLRDVTLFLHVLALLSGWAVFALAATVGRLPVATTLGAGALLLLVVLVGAGVQVWAFYDETVHIVDEVVNDPLAAEARIDVWSGWPPAGEDPGLAGAAARTLFAFNGWFMRTRQRVRGAMRTRGAPMYRRSAQAERPTQDGWSYVAALEKANVVLFDRTMKPFELAGVPLDSFTMTVDVTRFVNGNAGSPTLKATDLHRKLIAEVPDGSMPLLRADSLLVASGMQPKELGLFPPWRRGEPDPKNDPLLVPGPVEDEDAARAAPLEQAPAAEPDSLLPAGPGSVGATPEQLIGEPGPVTPPPDPRAKAGESVNADGWYLEHPDPWVEDAVIDDVVEGPPEGARAYAYFQKFSWRGQVVVCAAVRVYRSLNTLHIEFDAHALPPLADGFMNMYNVPETARNRRRAMWSTVLRATPRLLFRSVRHMYVLFLANSGRLTVIRQLQDSREGERRIDYGSRINLRLAAGDPAKLWRFPFVDELDNARVLRDRSLAVIRSYLCSYGIAVDAFDVQVDKLLDRATAYDAGRKR